MHSYDYDLLIKILVATLLGTIIGFERQKSQKPAGIRTQMLICVGSALLAGISVDLALAYGMSGANRPDPARLMAQIVSGIGFLGAGVIIKESRSNRISGVTTAATIWLTSAVGIAVGAGFYLVACACTVLALCLYPLAKWQRLSGMKVDAYTLSIPQQQWENVAELLRAHGIDCELWKLAGHTAHIKVHASQPSRHKLANSLHKARINFEIVKDGAPTLFA